MEIQENVNIKDFCTLRAGGQFRYMIEASNSEDVKNAFLFAREKNLKILPIGGGSNMIFSEGVIDVVALRLNILGFDILQDDGSHLDIRVGAGENWDKFVEQVCNMNLSGVEAMSAIPGTVGATPVQNVGAYGQEIKDTLVSVEVFDTTDLVFKTFSNKDCNFRYRDSIFKTEEKGRYIILYVILKLSKSNPVLPEYPGVKNYFFENKIYDINPNTIRQAIINIRKEKLPNPKEVPNVGSFFENPIILKSQYEKLAQSRALGEKIPFFEVDSERVKIPAGWLIEKAGLKGKNFGNVSVYEKNALVLVNNGGANSNDFFEARNMIIKTIFEQFGITLEQEPEIIK